jgi:uroporphyrinogen-III synthase
VAEFTAQGASVVEVPAYESRCPAHPDPAVIQALQAGRIDLVTFTSSKTVQNFCQLLAQADPGGSEWMGWLTDVALASIGPQTSQTCQNLLGRVDIEAKEYTLEGLSAAIMEYFRQI